MSPVTRKAPKGEWRRRRWPNPRTHRSRRLTLEPLEDRRLLALLWDPPVYELPVIAYDTRGVIGYDSSSGDLDVDNALAVQFYGTGTSVTGTDRTVDIQIQLDSSGALVEGAPGHLLVKGDIDADGDGDIDFDGDGAPATGSLDENAVIDGALLTGEILEFGFKDLGGASTTDYYDFRFRATGGALRDVYFVGKDIAVEVNSESSDFAGDFTTDFGGRAKGNIWPIEATPTPPQLPGVDIEKYVKPFDEGGGEGLTPGYWKQSQHFDEWSEPYDPGDSYNETFGLEADAQDDPDLTLLGALERGGGEENALGRHAMAALLNAAHPGVDYAFSTAEIVDMVQGAYATGEFEAVKDQLEPENELGADLSDAPSSSDTAGSEYGVDADQAPGLVVEVGSRVQFTYVVTNPNADVSLQNVTVKDDNGSPGDTSDDFHPTPVLEDGHNVGDTDGDGQLDPGEQWLYTHVSEPVTAGQHSNLAKVDAQAGSQTVSDEDPAHWSGVSEGSTIQGMVWEDADDDGAIDVDEQAIQGVAVELTGTDYQGNPVHQATVTDSDGVYLFLGVQPSNADGYTIHESQPAGYEDGQDVLGTVAGEPMGDDSVNDTFSGIVIETGEHGENYNFGELPTTATQDFVHQGQTATIGYWQNKNGQALIKSLNGGGKSTALGEWLAGNFENLYGDLEGMTNADVAESYKKMFRGKKKSKTDGPAKLDPQVMAVALAVYVTDTGLADGDYGASYGFDVNDSGVGASYFDVDAAVGAGTAETLFGPDADSVMSVMDILRETDERSLNGVVFEDDGDGQIEADEALMRFLANELFTAINESGDIG